MIAVPQFGFVFLAMPKCASSAIEPKLVRRGLISMPRNPLKHMPARDFERRIAPLIADAGYPRSAYETVCLFREPIDWLHSWWRYRSRPALADPASPAHQNYTGHVTFGEFADAYIEGNVPFAQLDGQGQAEFVRGPAGEVSVDRLFRYEDIELLTTYLSERMDVTVELRRRNVSPDRELHLSE